MLNKINEFNKCYNDIQLLLSCDNDNLVINLFENKGLKYCSDKYPKDIKDNIQVNIIDDNLTDNNIKKIVVKNDIEFNLAINSIITTIETLNNKFVKNWIPKDLLLDFGFKSIFSYINPDRTYELVVTDTVCLRYVKNTKSGADDYITIMDGSAVINWTNYPYYINYNIDYLDKIRTINFDRFTTTEQKLKTINEYITLIKKICQ